MSFSMNVKEELTHTDIKRECCALAELTAFSRMVGTMELGAKGALCIRFDCESVIIAKRIFHIIKKLYDVSAELSMQDHKKLGRTHRYRVKVDDSNIARKMLTDTGVFLEDGSYNIKAKLPHGMLERNCCTKAFIRGAFLGGGSLSDPHKGYHMEFVTRDEDTAHLINTLLKGYQINVRTAMRRDVSVIYIKEREHIIALLSLMGAHGSLLDMENVMVLKDVRNNVNRVVNCDTANVSKAMHAAERQIEDIRFIMNSGAYKRLSDELKQTAEARLNNPGATLQEIADLLDVTKSGVNHRLRRISGMARRIKESEGVLQ